MIRYTTSHEWIDTTAPEFAVGITEYAANELGEDPLALAARFADAYNADMTAFGMLPPDVEPRVSTHIAEIIAITEELIAAGKAYVVDGDVYYEVSTFPSYGKLSGQAIDELEAGARVDVD